MNIGTLIGLKSMDELDQQFITLREHGFDHCQISSWIPAMWTDENAATIKALCEKHGVIVSAFWCGWEGPRVWDLYEGQLTLGLVPPDYRIMRVKNLCDGADFALKFGVTDIVTHMGFIPENPYDPNFAPFCIAVRTVAQHLKENGQYLLFETGQETPLTMLRCFEQVGLDNLAVNFDTANLILYGKANPVDALDLLGPYVRNIHAKDGLYPTCGPKHGKEVRLGEGKVDFRAFFQKLHELSYDSHVTIEREIRGEQQTLDILHAKQYLENIIKEVYGA